MKMIVIIFLTLIIGKNILCDESNESKYIDLLPEEEKEQFLQKIARRIFEEAEVTDDQYKQSREVPDDQLNEHTDFVQKILREESANLRKTTKNKSEGDEKSDESIRVKPLKIDNTERVDDNQDRYIDLTLRQGSRKKRRDNFVTDVEQATEGKINVDVKYDTEENKVIENGESSYQLASINKFKEDSLKSVKEAESSFEDIQVKHFIRQGTTQNSNEVVSSTNVPRITKMEGFDAESAENLSQEVISSKQSEKKTEQPTPSTEAVVTEKTTTSFKRFTESIYEPIGSQEIESVKGSDTVANTQQTPIIEIIPPTNSTETQYVNDTKRVFNSVAHEAINRNITEDISKENATESTSYNNESGSINVNRLSENNTLFTDTYNYATTDFQPNVKNKNDEMLTENPLELTTYKTFFNDTYNSTTTDIQLNIEEKNEEITNKNIVETADNLNVNDINIKATTIFDTNSSIVVEESITEKQLIQTTQIIENTAKNTNKNREEFGTTTITIVKSDDTKNNIATTEIPGDVAKVLRKRLLEDEEKSESEESENEKRNKTVESGYNKIKQTYKVYELPPNQEPFVLKHSINTPKNEEAPQYVPIYNYSVNNAYFTAENRYGSNFEDSSEKSDTDVDDSGSQREDDNQSVSKESYGTLRNMDDPRKFRFGNKQNPKRSPTKIIQVINQKEYYPDVIINPDDYLDNDYYFGRTNINLRDGRQGYSKIFPDSSDESHPSANSIKDHIRSVRKILYENKIFGYVPGVDNSTDRPTKQKIKFTISPPFHHVKRQGDNNIEKDYYSESLKQDDLLDNKRQGQIIGYVKYNNAKRDLRLAKRVNEKMLKKIGVIKFNHKLFYRDDTFDDNKLANVLREKVTVYSADKKPEYFDTIYKVLKLTNEVDLIPTLNKMRDMNIPYMRNRYGNEYLKAYVEVLNDMLKKDTKALAQYNWLETTVEIQSAINRLMEMTEQVQSGIYLHPADLGLLKYVVYLYQTARTTLILNRYAIEELRSKIIPKNRKRIKSFLKEKGLLNRVWLFKRDNLIKGEILNDFKQFLNDLESALYDLHNAVKHIAIVTKYNKQAWFENLQRIYMKKDRKHLLEVILHLSANRLFGLIEDSAEKGAEVNYVEYMKKNDLDVGRSVDECVFVLSLLDEIKSLDS